MIGPVLTSRIRETYREWLKVDRFGHTTLGFDPNEPIPITSIRDFIKHMVARSAMPPPPVEGLPPVKLQSFDNMGITFFEFLSAPLIKNDALKIHVEEVAFKLVCLSVVEKLLRDVLSFRVSGTEDKKIKADLLEESGVKDTKTLFHFLSSPVQRRAVANIMYTELTEYLGKRTLRSFFVKEVNEQGYLSWWPGARTGAGRGLSTHSIPTELGTVSVDVSRYESGDVDPVNGYEWCAELRQKPGSETPDAIAYGMVYTFKCEDGFPLAGKSALLDTADLVADTDVLQVNAFFEQHADAHQVIGTSDLCFVWLWERQASSPKGAGKDCLRAAIVDLKKRFRRIRTIIIDIKPSQFISWDGTADPTSIQIEKQHASESLLEYIENLDLGSQVNGECRYIVNRQGSDPNGALAVLSKDMNQRMK